MRCFVSPCRKFGDAGRAETWHGSLKVTSHAGDDDTPDDLAEFLDQALPTYIARKMLGS